MANIYITEQQAIIRKTGRRLLVEKDGVHLLDLPVHKIDAVMLFGNVQFTTQAAALLLENDVELAILSRHGRLKGQITSPSPKNVFLRLAQYDRFKDSQFRLEICRRIVSAKIANCVELLRRHHANHPDPALKRAIEEIRLRQSQVEKADAITRLLGIEGAAAAIYFRAFGAMLKPPFSFPGRRKRPATDPVNAVLSLSYTMLFNEIGSLLDGLGFEPYLGFLHEPEYGRASLAADMAEEFRAPLADRHTLNLFNTGRFAEDDFYTNPLTDGVYFKEESMKKYLSLYDAFLGRPFRHPQIGQETNFRRCFRLQAEAMARTIRDNEPYQPFLDRRG